MNRPMPNGAAFAALVFIFLVFSSLLLFPHNTATADTTQTKIFKAGCTGSMEPASYCNDTLYAKETNGDVNVGDFVIFYYPNGEIAAGHRVIKKSYDLSGKYYITKGDNNHSDDTTWFGKVRPDDIKYIIVGVER